MIRAIACKSISGDIEYGYRGDARGQGGADAREVQGEKVPFFNNITIYGMWAGNFIAYTLINPVITTMDHDALSQRLQQLAGASSCPRSSASRPARQPCRWLWSSCRACHALWTGGQRV